MIKKKNQFEVVFHRLRYAHNSPINDFSILGIQIGIFTDMIFIFFLHLKLLTSFEGMIFYFSLLALNLYHIRSIFEDFYAASSAFIPVANFGWRLHNHSLIACTSSSLMCLCPHSLIKQRKYQITIIQTIFIRKKLQLFIKAIKT